VPSDEAYVDAMIRDWTIQQVLTNARVPNPVAIDLKRQEYASQDLRSK